MAFYFILALLLCVSIFYVDIGIVSASYGFTVATLSFLYSLSDCLFDDCVHLSYAEAGVALYASYLLDATFLVNKSALYRKIFFVAMVLLGLKADLCSNQFMEPSLLGFKTTE